MKIHPYIFPAFVDVFRTNGFVFEESVCHPNGPQLEAIGFYNLTCFANQKFRAATSNIDEKNFLLKHRQSLKGPQVDQASLFESGDNSYLDSCLSPGSLDKDFLVQGFTHRTGSHCPDFCLRDFRNLLKSFKCFNAPIHGIFFEILHVLGTRA